MRAELTILSREWDSVLSGWFGTAASSYAALWDEWHDSAAKLVESLDESRQLLERAAAAYEEQEATSARSVRNTPVKIGL